MDADELRAVVTEARRMAIEQDRAGACDTTLGQILAHAPEGQDAIWPAEAVRDIFEAEASEKMFEGLWVRSEEHTSELQSLMRTSYAVFCLKKKNARHKKTTENDNTRKLE